MSKNDIKKEVKRKERWYFGGLSACLITLIVHPLDTIKVHLQTHQGKNIGLVTVGQNIVKTGGALALYNGLSASLMRQMVYSGSRFGIYNIIRNAMTAEGRKQAFHEKLGGAAIAGAIGSFMGTPFDLVNVRMQNDIKLPVDQRRNYSWAGDGLARTLKEEGLTRTFKGGSFVSMRGAFMTIGQLAFYDTVKDMLLSTPYFKEGVTTHFTASITAAMIATLMTQPLDVIKTRVMQAKPGELRGYVHAVIITASLGPQAFMKGLTPSSIRIVPGTVLTFIVLEQLTLNFGYY